MSVRYAVLAVAAGVWVFVVVRGLVRANRRLNAAIAEVQTLEAERDDWRLSFMSMVDAHSPRPFTVRDRQFAHAAGIDLDRDGVH